MRILVTGSRDWDHPSVIKRMLLANFVQNTDEIYTLVSGACPTGADRQAEQIAEELGWNIELHPANWDKSGKRAGYLRNKEMVDLGADLCLAFIKNNSKGATMTAKLAVEAGILTYEIHEKII